MAADGLGAGQITVAGLSLAYRRRGSGPPLLLLHNDIGAPEQLPLYGLLARRHDLIALDLPGFGASQRATWARNVRDLAAIVGLAIDALGLARLALVGCGFGGWLAAELASFGTNRFASLTLVGPMGIKPEQGEITDQFLLSHENYVKLGFHDETRYAALFGDPAPIEQLLRWDTHREATMRVAWKPYMFNRALPALLASVSTPSFIVMGEHDRIVPRDCAARYCAALPAARLEVVARTGHRVEMEAPERLAELLAGHAGAA
jgi:pimeloyl-ACP methyl ester carboxylesterase